MKKSLTADTVGQKDTRHKSSLLPVLLTNQLSLLGIPVSSTGHQVHTGTCTLQVAETRDHILASHRAELSRHRIRGEEEDLISFFFHVYIISFS